MTDGITHVSDTFFFNLSMAEPLDSVFHLAFKVVLVMNVHECDYNISFLQWKIFPFYPSDYRDPGVVRH